MSAVTASGLPNLNDPAIVAMAEHARRLMRDYPELNRLTAGYDHSPRLLKWAVLDTLSDWSSTPPFLGHTLQHILDRNWTALFLRGVVINALVSLGILHLRNHLSYSDGGVNVQTEHPQMIQSWIGMLRSEYEAKKQRLLIAANIENALDQSQAGVSSEYWLVNSFYGYL